MGRSRAWRRRCLLFVTSAGSLFLIFVGIGGEVPPASSQTVGRITNGVPEAIVVVTRDGTLSSWRSSSSRGTQWRCGYYAVVAPQMSVLDPTPVVDWVSGPVNPIRGESYILGCTDQSGERVYARYVAFDPQDPFSGVAETPRAVDEARRQLEIPAPSPQFNPPGSQLAGVPTWLWLTEPWDRRSAVASIGSTWASVEAWPVSSEWEFDDGTQLSCGRGQVYDFWRRPKEQTSECTHTFQRSSLWSSGGVEWVQVTVNWAVAWSSSDGDGGTLGQLTRTIEFPIRVVEAQALVR